MEARRGTMFPGTIVPIKLAGRTTLDGDHAMADTGTAYADRVKGDHYLHLAALWGSGLYAWQVHNFWIGGGMVIALYVFIGAMNLFIMTREMVPPSRIELPTSPLPRESVPSPNLNDLTHSRKTRVYCPSGRKAGQQRRTLRCSRTPA